VWRETYIGGSIRSASLTTAFKQEILGGFDGLMGYHMDQFQPSTLRIYPGVQSTCKLWP
jgi:hypothetical protein